MGRYECPKCGGTGRIDCYKHVNGGLCFMCNGSGRVDRKPRTSTPRTPKTYEQKQEAIQRQNMRIIDGEYSDTIKRFDRAFSTRPELTIVLNSLLYSYLSMPKTSVSEARIAAEKTMRYLYRLSC